MMYICTLKFNDSLAQLVEQYTFNVWALGSNPRGITKKVHFERIGLFYFTALGTCFYKLRK